MNRPREKDGWDSYIRGCWMFQLAGGQMGSWRERVFLHGNAETNRGVWWWWVLDGIRQSLPDDFVVQGDRPEEAPGLLPCRPLPATPTITWSFYNAPGPGEASPHLFGGARGRIGPVTTCFLPGT